MLTVGVLQLDQVDEDNDDADARHQHQSRRRSPQKKHGRCRLDRGLHTIMFTHHRLKMPPGPPVPTVTGSGTTTESIMRVKKKHDTQYTRVDNFANFAKY